MIQIRYEQFRRSMQSAADRIDNLSLKVLETVASLATISAKQTTLFVTRTGKLKKSISHKVTSKYRASVRASAPYAGFVEEGTRPHVIRARRARVLRFVKDGAVHFRKQVFHPGTKPRPFMTQARDKVEPLFERLCVEAINNWFRRQ